VNVPLWAAELADAFWDAAGLREPFPRGLLPAIRRGWPINVVPASGLRLRTVREWVAQNHFGFACSLADRRLRACLLARAGVGYVFLDEGDPEDERRFSLAHEVAHFLRHYWQPRQQACRRLGPAALEVLDGERPPTFEERVQALLGEVSLGYHLHLMAREPGGGADVPGIVSAEGEADRLAYELLAPAEEVFRVAGKADIEELLRKTFGLPARHARLYGRLLAPPAVEDPLLGRLLPG
jgi:hypothetical protein